METHPKFVYRLATIYLDKHSTDMDDAIEWANRIVPHDLVPRVRQAMKEIKEGRNNPPPTQSA